MPNSVMTSRHQTLERLARAREGGEFIVGAAIGTGLLAHAAEQGGADFLVVLSAGRLRLMGAPSVASILPVRDCYRFVQSFADAEVMGRAQVPVYFATATMNPLRSLETMAAEIVALGFAGIANFPSVAHFPQPARQALERSGFGFERELRLLALAHRHGIGSLAYVRTRDHARAAAAQGIDLICCNFGWNAGGMHGPASELSLEEASAHALEMQRLIRRENPEAMFFLEGGPIQDTEQLAAICRIAKIHGYIGGSTIDRLPLAESVVGQVQRFKQATALARVLSRREEVLIALGERHGLIGRSQAMIDVYDALERFRGKRFPVLVCGEAHSGRATVVEALHAESGSAGNALAVLEITDAESARLALIELFGRAATMGGAALTGLAARADITTIAVRGIEHMPARLQLRLASSLRRQRFSPFGDRRTRPLDGKRLVLVSGQALDAPLSGGQMHPALAELLRGHEIQVPPLRQRSEDVEPLLLHYMRESTAQAGSVPTLSPGAMGLLRRHAWPGNLLELRRIAATLQQRHASGRVGQEAVAQLLAPDAFRPSHRIQSERDIILDALWRHRFKRGATAQFLGVSRKTLYNKIRRYRLGS